MVIANPAQTGQQPRIARLEARLRAFGLSTTACWLLHPRPAGRRALRARPALRQLPPSSLRLLACIPELAAHFYSAA